MKIFKLIKEAGVFHVPETVLAPIKDFVRTNYYKFIEENRKRITTTTFPPQSFVLDFSGTSYEFLNELDPGSRTVTVHFFNNKSESAYAIPTKQEIYINFANSYQFNFSSTIEHEIMHIVQQLISEKIGSKEVAGGLVPNRFRSKEYDVEGYKLNDKSYDRRTWHSDRDVEKYPDLVTLIRHLQLAYEAAYDQNFSFLQDKKEFLNTFISNAEELKQHMPIQGLKSLTNAIYLWDGFKNKGGDYRKWILKKIYDEFINQPNNFDAIELLDQDLRTNVLRQEVQEREKNKKKEKIQSSEVLFNAKNRKGEEARLTVEEFNAIPSYKELSLDLRYKLLPDGLEEEYVETWGDLLPRLPYLQERSSGEYEDIYVSIPIKYKPLKSIFSKLNEIKSIGGTDYLSSNHMDEVMENLSNIISDCIKENYWLDVSSEEIKREFLK